MNRSKLRRLRIVVLAAGFSTRLGKPKALARVHGVSLIRRTVALLAPFTQSRTVVVVPPRSLRYGVELHGLEAILVANFERGNGLSSSVRRAIARARYSSAILLVPVDLAALSRRDIARLIARWRGARRRVVAARLANRPGTPLILPRWLYARAASITGDVGLRELMARLPAQHVALVSLPSAARDIDTPQDLRDARRRPITKVDF
jgi:molybdenum cofactor cytidylyltransferase